MGKTIAVAQHKGGTGKTTTCINLGASLCALGKRVLLIDLDPQTSLTLSMGINPLEIKRSIHDVLVNPEVVISEVTQGSRVQNLFIVPSHIDLAVVDMELAGRIGRERALQKKLSPFKEEFDFIFIDCPPTLGILTVNALGAAEGVIIPIQCEPLALYGVKHLLNVINLVREEINEGLKIEGVLMTMLDRRTKLSKEVADSIKETFGELVFNTIIYKRIKLAEGPVHESPIMFYAPNSPGAKEYESLAEELISHEARKA
jgi:chromosome partitioning protein